MSRILAVLLLAAVLCSEAAMLGGYKKKADHENDARTQEVADFAVSEIGKKLNKSLKLERVVDVATQVVAGLNYRLVLDVSGGDHSTVEAVVYEPLGGKPLELTSHKDVSKDEVAHLSEAASERSQEAVSGGFAEVATSDAGVKKASSFAVQTLAGASNSLYPLTLKNVVNARKRVGESGEEYELELVLSQNTLPDKVYNVKVLQPLGQASPVLQSCAEKA